MVNRPNRTIRERSNVRLSSIAFLLFVKVLPFSTALLAESTACRMELFAYGLNISLLRVTLYLSRGWALRSGLAADDNPSELPLAVCGRVTIAQALYTSGALLCIISKRGSIALIVAVQLHYRMAPRFLGRRH